MGRVVRFDANNAAPMSDHLVPEKIHKRCTVLFIRIKNRKPFNPKGFHSIRDQRLNLLAGCKKISKNIVTDSGDIVFLR